MIHSSPQTIPTPSSLLQLPLTVGIYPGPGYIAHVSREVYWHLRHEGNIAWNVRVFDSTKHFAAVMATWSPNVLITHWHGQYDHGVPQRIAESLREKRGTQLGKGPFIVGQFSHMDSRFTSESDHLVQSLLEVFDMIYEIPIKSDIVPQNIATGICLTLHRERGSTTELAFDHDFTAYLPRP